MKQTRFLLAALLLMVCGIMAHAQKVVVYKHDGTKVEYASSEVKDVKYEKVYYYYAGWTCPTSIEELVKLAVGDNGSQIKPEDYTIGSEMKYFDGTSPLNSTYANYYLVIPEWIGLYDSEGVSTLEDTFDDTGITIEGYKLFKSKNVGKKIVGIMFKRIK